jgi:hypothetical protein
MRNRRIIGIAIAFAVCAVAGALLLPTSVDDTSFARVNANLIQRLDLSGFTPTRPAEPLDLLFIHHSCGGELLAAPGREDGGNCILRTHPNGGGLRTSLEQNSYRVHEASYGSRLGQHTDVFDWLPKFRSQMDQILSCDLQDSLYANGRRNQIVVFKSCFPNNLFLSEGLAPGNPAGQKLTVWDVKAAYTALLDEFRRCPDVLFVCVTAPPLASNAPPQALWKQLARKVLGRANSLAASGPLARQFNNWLSSTDGWLKNYTLKNVVVFDYYDILTGHGRSNFSIYPTGNGFDSHPSSTGNSEAANALVPLLNRAARRLGLARE